jgi:rSAM/selenodomain-associated transferase 2
MLSVTRFISIVIPTYNEAPGIATLIKYLKDNSNSTVVEIIVSDGGSNDATVALAKKAGAIAVVAPLKGRAAQMNYGASKASGNILYFVHADTFPPISFAADIVKAVNDGYDCGRYQTKFNSAKSILKFNAFFTRFDWFICYGGDQTFFITKKLFNELNGFNNTMAIMEEFDLTARAKQKGRYKIFNKTALVSARKYEGRSWWQVQMANKKAVEMFRKGASQQQIADTYKAMLESKG